MTESRSEGINQEDARLLPRLSTTKSTAQVTSAGRDLDALIAEKVMGLADVGYYRRGSCRTGDFERCEKGDVTPDKPNWPSSLYYHPHPDRLWAVPRYSTDIADAWLVVEKLGDMSVHHFYDPTLEEWFYHVAWRSPDGIEHHCSEEATTAPLAICLAALRALDA